MLTLPSPFDLSTLLPANGGDGSAGFVVNGVDGTVTSDPGHMLGNSVSAAGDVNGDGIDDLIIGAYRADGSNDGHSEISGRAYVVFGTTDGFAPTLDPATLNGTNGFTLTNSLTFDRFARSVKGAGDVNGDGFDDLVIGATHAYGTGTAHVVFGKAAALPPVLNVNTLDGSNGFAIRGNDGSGLFGFSVGSGDVNGDGFRDIVVGGRWNNPNGANSGRTAIVFGHADSFPASISVNQLDGTNGFVINGINAGDESGADVSAGGDVNDDGYDDIVIGAFLADQGPNVDSGAAYVVFGQATFSASLELVDLDGINGFVVNGGQPGDHLGGEVQSAGDYNADGIDDIMLAAARGGTVGRPDTGQVFVLFGKSSGFGTSVDVAGLNGNDGFVINGVSSGDRLSSVDQAAGDFNADGIDDIVIGAFRADPDGVNETGASYVVFGTTQPFSASFDLAQLDGNNGIEFRGIDPDDRSGAAVSSAGDVNGDGVDDVVLGATFADPDGKAEAGQAYVVFGVPSNEPPVADAGGLYSVPEGGSIQLDGSASFDPDGGTLTYAWDFDGDGDFDDATGVRPGFSAAGLDGPDSVSVELRVTDQGGSSDSVGSLVEITNVAPVVDAIVAPLDPNPVNMAIAASASFTDDGAPDTHTATWDWGDGTIEVGTVAQGAGSGSVSDSHVYVLAGVNTITLTVTDDDTGSGQSEFQFVVVYDPNAGFVTGGGWVDSPEGAYYPDPTLSGKAHFGFVSKYQHGANVPSGQTQFQFKKGDLNFHSTEYQWLVVAGSKAKYKGAGTINGEGDFGFMLIATDGQINGGGGEDKFRFKIWDKSNGDAPVYDNQMGAADDADPTAVVGGSIVIHSENFARPNWRWKTQRRCVP